MVQPKKTKASEARFHIQPCGEQVSGFIDVTWIQMGQKLDQYLVPS